MSAWFKGPILSTTTNEQQWAPGQLDYFRLKQFHWILLDAIFPHCRNSIAKAFSLESFFSCWNWMQLWMSLWIKSGKNSQWNQKKLLADWINARSTSLVPNSTSSKYVWPLVTDHHRTVCPSTIDFGVAISGNESLVNCKWLWPTCRANRYWVSEMAILHLCCSSFFASFWWFS